MTLLPGNFTPTYDANGNVLNDSNHTYAWDADNNSVTVDAVGLAFDALDRMVEQNRSGAYTQIVYAPTGAKLALMNGQSLVKAFFPLPGQAIAVYASSGLDHYRHSDWLGSARLTSSPSRTFLSSTAYAPFGEPYAQSGAADLSFTGQNQDTVSGDDDFLFREYSTQGRWASPDPAGLAAADPSNPQSWNRYAYVLNNPLARIDLLGLDCVFLNDAGDGIAEIAPELDAASCSDAGGVYFAGSIDPSSFRADPNSDFVFANGLDGTAQFSCGGGVCDQESLTAFGDSLFGRSSTTVNAQDPWSWTIAFTRSFLTFSGGPGNKPTCAGQALTHIAGEFIPFVPGGSSVIQATAPAAQAMAFNSAVAQTEAGIDAYIAARGLTVPLRSTIVRAMAAQGAKNAVAAGARANFAVQTIAVDYAALHSMYTTSGQARSGECAAAFPIF
ncbi:MAG TPA: RHS repeat-associated core domain-containing protein [Candidatus Dormibacteraeota bacterium]|nr:RHS repeat-associated core domain-containing protein [Candidatus Dormibacteraeota bacterium]